MIRKFAFATLVFTTFSGAAMAVNVTPPASVTENPAAAPSTADSLNSLTPMAGNPKPAKVNYDNLSRAEKLKMINERHAASAKKSEARWKAMSDDEKIAKYEKRRNSFMARRAGKQQNAAAANNLAPAAGIAPAGGVTLTGAAAPEGKTTDKK